MKNPVIYKPGDTNIQCLVIEKNGVQVSSIGGWEIEPLFKHGYQLMELDEAIPQIEKAVADKYREGEWAEISEEQWEEALDSLPPQRWVTVDGVQMFGFQEFLIGNVRAFYTKYQSRYFCANLDNSLTNKEIAKLCREFVKNKK